MAKHGPNNKIDLKYNYIGQPCGSKTSKLSNFAAYLVKGKDVSMGAISWRKVPAAEKEKLWQSIKVYFAHFVPVNRNDKQIDSCIHVPNNNAVTELLQC